MRLLLTWYDRAFGAPNTDGGPVLRLLRHAPRYDAAWVLCARADRGGAKALAQAMAEHVDTVTLHPQAVRDPSDYAELFAALQPLPGALPPAEIDVVLSAGTPQAQTLWVVLVQARLLNARMLQVIPPRYVPHPHPEPVREVRLDIEGFPEIRALRDEVHRLRARVAEVTEGLVGDAPAMRQLAQRLARVAAAEVPVLVLGETGTGKELVARAIHDASPRSGPFVAENCGALAEGVLASELFGHEPGAFTGAASRRKGLFEQAHGGTLFLDEVGEMPPAVQVKLLRALQTGEIRRLGAEAPTAVDVRVVAATHRDLPAMVAAGTFREDLWYRLRGAELRVPPLRERPGDLERLVVHFLKQAGAQLRLTRRAWAALEAHRWPGNVRELQAEVRRWTVFCDDVVDWADLSAELQVATPLAPAPSSTAPSPDEPSTTLAEAVRATERRVIEAALSACSGNLSATARRLGIDRNTLKRKLRRDGRS